ncbi:MAG TPA: hypothetical protein VM617_04160 [Thermoanaerobaculia bacterium]|nr:hypothetical protein [Thermoanaerobaculia bacterium]
MPAAAAPPEVATVADLARGELATLLARYRLTLVEVAAGAAIPGSFWGEPEAGIVGDRVFVRQDTPVHSALHEACHLICAGDRRAGIDTDAGGSYEEEDAVCYLQIVLAGELVGVGARRMMDDMDAWGYTFRLGSAAAWFAGDADEARQWLVAHRLLDATGRPRSFAGRVIEGNSVPSPAV